MGTGLKPTWVTEGKKRNFYLQSSKIPRPACWYSTMPIGMNKVRSVVGELLRNVELDGYFRNHSYIEPVPHAYFKLMKVLNLSKK